jgi:hypothetical protein
VTSVHCVFFLSCSRGPASFMADSHVAAAQALVQSIVGRCKFLDGRTVIVTPAAPADLTNRFGWPAAKAVGRSCPRQRAPTEGGHVAVLD